MRMKANSGPNKISRETVMNFKSKTAAALAIVTLATAFAATEANAKGKGWAIGAGIVGAAIVGSAIANSYAYGEPVYVDDVPRCRFVRQYNAYGYYVRTARVCSYY